MTIYYVEVWQRPWSLRARNQEVTIYLVEAISHEEAKQKVLGVVRRHDGVDSIKAEPCDMSKPIHLSIVSRPRRKEAVPTP